MMMMMMKTRVAMGTGNQEQDMHKWIGLVSLT